MESRPNRPHTFETKVGWETHYHKQSATPGFAILPVVEWDWYAFQYRGAVQFLRLTDGIGGVVGPVQRATLKFRRRVAERPSDQPLRRILVASAPWESGYHPDPTTHDDGLEPRGREIPTVPDLEIPFRVDGDLVEADVTDVVRRWVSGDLPNHGLVLLSQERFARMARPDLFVEATRVAFYNDFVLEVRTPGFVTLFSSGGRTPIRRGTFSTR
jgi:hypothetical protein